MKRKIYVIEYRYGSVGSWRPMHVSASRHKNVTVITDVLNKFNEPYEYRVRKYVSEKND